VRDWQGRPVFFAARRSYGNDGEKDQDGIDGMTVTERSVSNAEDERIEQGKDCQWHSERIFRASDEQQACGGAECKQEIAEKNCANEKRVCVKKVAQGMLSADPGGDDSSPG